MEGDEKQKRVEAGKEKLAAYLKKKKSSHGQRLRKQHGIADATHNVAGDSSDLSVTGSLQSPLSPTGSSISTLDSSDDCSRRISELEDILAGKEAPLRALQDELLAAREGSSLEQQQSRPPNITGLDFKSRFDEYDSKIGEFQKAIIQRDDIIEQLTSSLKNALAHRDFSQQQGEQLARDVALLQSQLQEARRLLDGQSWASGVKPADVFALRNKLLELEAQKDQQLKLIEDLRSKSTEKELKLEQNKHELNAIKVQSAKEVQQLMGEVQRLHQENSTLIAEKQDIFTAHRNELSSVNAQLEERFGLQLVQIRSELTALQEKHIENLCDSHKRELDMMEAIHKKKLEALQNVLQEHDTKQEDQQENAKQMLQLQLEVQSLNLVNNGLASELSSIREQQTHWSQSNLSIGTELEALKEKLMNNSSLKVDLDVMRQEKEEALLQVQTLTKRLQSVEQERDSINQKLTSQINILSNIHQENDAELLILKVKIVEVEDEKLNISSRLESVENERNALKKQTEKVIQEVQSLQSKCDILQAECAGLLSEKKDTEVEIEHLYSQVQDLREEVANAKISKSSDKQVHNEGTNNLDAPVEVCFENEVDAVEKGVFSPTKAKLDVPFSSAAFIVWMEKCELFEKELRTSQANAMRLQTQLQQEEVQSKLLLDEKSTSVIKIKELNERVNSLEKIKTHYSKSKKLVSQLEMKVACLENEKSNLQQSLNQLGEELQKSQSLHNKKLDKLQEQLCNSSDLKSDNLEELIVELCSKAKELLVVKENLRSITEEDNLLRVKVESLKMNIQQLEESLKASQEELDVMQGQLVESWQRATQQEEEDASRRRELALLTLHTEQLSRQLKSLPSPEEGASVWRDLQAVIEELAGEVVDLKSALSTEKARNDALAAGDVSLKSTFEKKLLKKLQEQKDNIELLKSETEKEEWSNKMEMKLGEMIDDLTAYATNHDITQLESDYLSSQSALVEQAELEQERANSRGLALKLKLIESQLADKDKKYEDLVKQKASLEQELQTMELCIIGKETLLQDQRLRLETEIRRRDLQIRQCEADARYREMELRVSQSLLIRDIEEKNGELGYGSRVDALKTEMDQVHSEAVARLKMHLCEEFSLREAEMSEKQTKQEADLKQQHAEQVSELQRKLEAKEHVLREGTFKHIASQLGLSSENNASEALTQIQERHKAELARLKQNLPRDQSGVFASMEEKFHQFAQQQVILALTKLKEESEASFVRELTSLNDVHQERISALKAKSLYEKERDLHLVKQDFAKQHKESLNKMTAHIEASKRLELILEPEKENKSNMILACIEKETQDQYIKALKHLAETWKTTCKSKLRSLTCEINSTLLSKDTNLDAVENIMKTKEALVTFAQDIQAKLASQHAAETKNLLQSLSENHKALKNSAKLLLDLDSLQQQVLVLTKERDQLEEKHRDATQDRDLEQLREVMSQLKAGGQGVVDLLQLKQTLENQHTKEVEELRTYFEQKCSDMEKRYSEEVFSQHSRKLSGSSASEDLNSAEMLCSSNDHAIPLASMTHLCDTFSDEASFNDIESQHGLSGDRRISEGTEELRESFENKYERDLKSIRAEYESQIRDLVRDLRNAHQEELDTQASGHEEQIAALQLQLSSLQHSNESVYKEHLEVLRAEMSVMENSRVASLRGELEQAHAQELETLQLSPTDTLSGEVPKSFVKNIPERSTREDLKAKFERENGLKLVEVQEDLRVKFESELQTKLEEQSEAIARQVDEITANMKKDAENEQARLVSSHQKIVEQCLEEQKIQLDTLRNQYDIRIAETRVKYEKTVTEMAQNLRQLHEQEMTSVEEKHSQAMQDFERKLRQELTKEHELHVELLTEKIVQSHKLEMENLENRILATQKMELDTLKSSLEQQEASYVRLLEETRNAHARELADLSEHGKQRLHEEVEQARHELVRTLGEQIQALLADDSSVEAWPLELRQLQERLDSETRRQLSEIKIQHEAQVRDLKEAHKEELALLKNLKAESSRDSWRMECHILRRLVSELLHYFIALDEELNHAVDQGRGSDTDSIVSADASEQTFETSDCTKKRVRFAPCIETITSILKENSFTEGSNTVEDIKKELENSILKLRRDLADTMGISEANLVGQKTQQEVEELRRKMASYEGQKSELEMDLRMAREKLTELMDTKKRETITEGYGFYGQVAEQIPDLDRRFKRLSELQDKARLVLKSVDTDNPGPPHLLALIEELCREGDQLSEEARKDKEDLQLQVEVADKQLRSTRAFLEDQAAEREQERDEFSRELKKLQDTVKERERDRVECARQAKEIEALEAQVKETQQFLQQCGEKREELQLDLKAASDKISVLRDIVTDLENQVEIKSKTESELRKRLVTLQKCLDQESQSHSCLVDELDSLRSDASNADLVDQISILEEQVLRYTQELDCIKKSSKAVRDMKAQLRTLEATVDRRTKELERLHNVSLSTCSSPSEDVSIREQLEASRASLMSPESDENLARCSSPLSLRRLQEKLQQHSKAEEAAVKRIRDLEMQLNTVRHSEEEVQTERQGLQQRVEEQLLQISGLQASMDQQRLHVAGLEAKDAAQTRRQLQNAAERLDQARELIEAKDKEVSDLRSALEKSKKVVVNQEEEFTKKFRETEAEICSLRDQLEAAQGEKDALESALEEIPARTTPLLNARLMDSLLAEKNSEIDDLSLQVSVLRERLELISTRLTSDLTRDDVLDLVRDLRASHSELRSHCSAVHGAQCTSHRGSFSDMEVMRAAGPDSTDFLHQISEHGTTVGEATIEHTPVKIIVATPIAEESTVNSTHDESPAPRLVTPVPPSSPGPSQEDLLAVQEELHKSQEALGEKDSEINELKQKVVETDEKLRELQEENAQLKQDLNTVSGRLEEYAQLMQSELDHSASLDQSLLQASGILLGSCGQADTSSSSMASADVSCRTETLQRLLARVQRGGFEVLSLSEVALLHQHTLSLLHADKISTSTQTDKKMLDDAKQLTELRQNIDTLQKEIAAKEQAANKKVATAEAALVREKQIRNELETALTTEQQTLQETRQTLTTQTTEMTEFRHTHAAQVTEMRQLRDGAEEVQGKVEQQERQLQQLRLQLEKEKLRATALESSLAAEEINSMRQRCQLEAECIRHRSTMARNTSLSDMLDAKLAQAQETEGSLRTCLEQEQALRRSLQEQISALQRTKDSGTLDSLNQELKASLEKEQLLTGKLLTTLREEREAAMVRLRTCEERERGRASAELTEEKANTQSVRSSLLSVQQQLQETLTQIQSERESNNALQSRIQELAEELVNARETRRQLLVRREAERAEEELHRQKMEETLDLLSQQKKSIQHEADQMKQQLMALTQKWEEQFQKEKTKAWDLKLEETEMEQLRSQVRTLETRLVRARLEEQRVSTLAASEKRAWGSERALLMSQTQALQHEVMTTKTLLATERANWVLEKLKLQGDVNAPQFLDSTSDLVAESRMQYLFGKCLRMESYRKALVWQKRYLIIVLKAYQDSEEKVKMQLMQLQHLHSARPELIRLLKEPSHPLSPLQRFRAASYAILAIHRLKFIVKSHLRAYNIAGNVVVQRVTNAMLMSPEPRYDPPSASLNGHSRFPGLSPPTRDEFREERRSQLSSPRSLSSTPRRTPLNEYCIRSDILQQKLGLLQPKH